MQYSNNDIRELNAAEIAGIAGGIGIGGGGRGGDFGDSDSAIPIVIGGSPYGGVAGGLPIIPIIGGGRDWWIVPGDLNPIVPVPKPEPGKP